jgi:hypothetical protein
VCDFETVAPEGVMVGETDAIVPVEETDEVLCGNTVFLGLLKDSVASLVGVGVLCGVAVFGKLFEDTPSSVKKTSVNVDVTEALGLLESVSVHISVTFTGGYQVSVAQSSGW